MKYIVALDQGTTSSRAVVVDENGKVVAVHGMEFPQIYPQPGWVEHDPAQILSSQVESLKKAVEKAAIDPKDIVGIGITNQRETTIIWDKATGKPVCNAIVWQCRRTAAEIERLKAEGASEIIRKKTGLIPDAYFCGSKIQWILRNVPGTRVAAQAGELLFGTVDTWLIWNLTREHAHVTDVSNASRTMLFNIHTMDWDQELLDLMEIPHVLLPKVVDSSGVVGMLDKSILGVEIPIAGIAGDQQAALFGQACYEKGMVKTTYGTGGFLLMQTGTEAVESENGLLTTVAWRMGGKTEYALEGSVFVAGASIQWLRDEMKLISSAAESEEVALSVPDTAGVYVVPAFTGMGAPYWDMYGRGAIVGLTRGAGRAHIVRATLEAIAFQNADVMDAMTRDSGIPLSQMRADGGASANGFLMQFQADVLGIPVVRPAVTETTAMGAAYLAGLAVGVWESREQVAALWRTDRIFQPQWSEDQRAERLRQWHRAVLRAMSWAE
jgi:glycerol kinase